MFWFWLPNFDFLSTTLLLGEMCWCLRTGYAASKIGCEGRPNRRKYLLDRHRRRHSYSYLKIGLDLKKNYFLFYSLSLFFFLLHLKLFSIHLFLSLFIINLSISFMFFRVFIWSIPIGGKTLFLTSFVLRKAPCLKRNWSLSDEP